MTWLLNLFRRKPVVKLMSLLGAIILWSFVMNEQNPMMETTVKVPVELLHTAEQTNVTPNQREVQVKLRGPRASFASLDKRDVHAFLDVEQWEDGYHYVRVQTAVPQGLEAVSVSPDTLNVLVDPLTERAMTPNLIQAGTVGAGFTVAAVTPEEPTVAVYGPSTQVGSVAQVIGYVGLSADRVTDFDLEVPLSAVDEDGRPLPDLTVTPNTLTVHVQLARGLSKKVVDVKPVLEGLVPSEYVLSDMRIEPARIEIAGESAVLDKITAIETEPMDISNVTATHKRVAHLVLPDGVTVTNNSVNITMTVKKK